MIAIFQDHNLLREFVSSYAYSCFQLCPRKTELLLFRHPCSFSQSTSLCANHIARLRQPQTCRPQSRIDKFLSRCLLTPGYSHTPPRAACSKTPRRVWRLVCTSAANASFSASGKSSLIGTGRSMPSDVAAAEEDIPSAVDSGVAVPKRTRSPGGSFPSTNLLRMAAARNGPYS